jgi:hypothetical protein
MLVDMLAMTMAAFVQPVEEVCIAMIASGKSDEITRFWSKVDATQRQELSAAQPWRIAEKVQNPGRTQFIKIVTTTALPSAEAEARRMNYWPRWLLITQAADDREILLLGPSEDPQGCGEAR